MEHVGPKLTNGTGPYNIAGIFPFGFHITLFLPEFFDKRLNQKNVREFLDENPDKLPKGLNSDSTYTISVRSPKK